MLGGQIDLEIGIRSGSLLNRGLKGGGGDLRFFTGSASKFALWQHVFSDRLQFFYAAQSSEASYVS